MVLICAEMVAILCIKQGCTGEYCVSKCCKKDELFVQESSLCAPGFGEEYSWLGKNKFHDQNLKLIPGDTVDNIKIQYSQAFMDNHVKYKDRVPHCNKVLLLSKHTNDTFHLLNNGSLHHADHGTTTDYCVDNSLDMEGNVMEIALKCFHEVETRTTNIKVQEFKPVSCIQGYENFLLTFNTLSGIISCIFLVITFFVYVYVPELNNLHGKIVLCNVLSIFLTTVFLLCVYNFSDHFSLFICKVVGYSGFFFIMSMFMWMTIMSFDLCWTFIRAKLPRRGSALVKFIIYSVIAWGSSASFTLGLILVDQLMQDEEETQWSMIAKPNVGESKCFITEEAQGLYLHLPIFILMMINTVFFVITTTTLFMSKLTTHQARHARQQTSLKQKVPTRITIETKEQLILYSKLFTVMGILWIFECIHYLLHGDHRNMECLSSTEFILRTIGCINLLRGCLIFFIFVMKNSTLDKIGKLSLCGLQFRHARQETSKATTVTTDTAYSRQESDLSIPLITLH